MLWTVRNVHVFRKCCDKKESATRQTSIRKKNEYYVVADRGEGTADTGHGIHGDVSGSVGKILVFAFQIQLQQSTWLVWTKNNFRCRRKLFHSYRDTVVVPIFARTRIPVYFDLLSWSHPLALRISLSRTDLKVVCRVV